MISVFSFLVRYKPMTKIIEDLPNELFFEIFQYLDGFQLYSSWFDLNQRFQKLVYSINMCVEIDEFEIDSSFLLQHAKQCVSIRLVNRTRVLKQLDLALFSNIHSLYLNLITTEQYDQIIPENFPLLTNLKLNAIVASRNFAMLLFGSKPFACLKSCYLPYFLLTNEPLQSCLTVRSLSLEFCSAEVFFTQIKIYLPNLSSFETISGTDITFIQSIDQQNVFLPHRNLRSIRIVLGKDTTFDYLPLILTVLPELRSLKLYCRAYCDYRQVAELIQTKLIQLKYFDLTVNESRFQRLPDVEILRRMSSWFSRVEIERSTGFNRIVCKTTKKSIE